MSEQSDILNKLIAADDLHWCEDEQKYTSISKEELDEVIINCFNGNIKEIDEVMKVVNWAILVKTGTILLKNFVEGKISIVGFDEQDEPLFGEKNEYL